MAKVNETPEITPFDWTAMPTGRTFEYYGRKEVDAFNATIMDHMAHTERLYATAIDLLGETREEAKEERSNVHHLDTILDDLETHRVKLMDEITGYDNPFGDGGSIKFTANHGDPLSKWFDDLWKITGRRKIGEGRQN